jgi:hypothetical protein
MSHTSVAITKEASQALDVIAKQTGMSKLYLASTVIKLFFDPETNPALQRALDEFQSDKQAAEKTFVKTVISTMRSEPTND